jgi:peptidoglycan/LPS O-acetylase OafA/YrhL
MGRLAPAGLRSGRRTRRIFALLALALLCLTLVIVFAGPASAAEGQSQGGVIVTSNGTEIQTSKGMEAPELDYNFVWWSFIITFGLLFIYYIVVLRISDTEFKKIVDAHFGPKQEER